MRLGWGVAITLSLCLLWSDVIAVSGRTIEPGTRFATAAVDCWFANQGAYVRHARFPRYLPFGLTLRTELGVARRLSLGAELGMEAVSGFDYFPPLWVEDVFAFGPILTWQLPAVARTFVPYLGASWQVVFAYRVVGNAPPWWQGKAIGGVRFPVGSILDIGLETGGMLSPPGPAGEWGKYRGGRTLFAGVRLVAGAGR